MYTMYSRAILFMSHNERENICIHLKSEFQRKHPVPPFYLCAFITGLLLDIKQSCKTHCLTHTF